MIFLETVDFGVPFIGKLSENYLYLFLLVFGGLWEGPAMFLGIYQSTLGNTSLFLVLPSLFLSSWIWNNGLYWTGRFGGSSTIERYLSNWDGTEKYSRYLEWKFKIQIFLWQFMGPAKAALVYASGRKRVEYSKFCFYYTSALAVWHTFLFGLSNLLLQAGYGMAESLGLLKTFTRSLLVVVVGILLIGFGVHMIAKFIRKSLERE